MADYNFMLTMADVGNKLVDLSSDDAFIVLLTADYTPSETLDHYLEDIPGGAIVATSPISGLTFNGIWDGTDINFSPGPDAGSVVTQAVIYVSDGASPETFRLVRKISADSYGGFPFTTNGLAIILSWPNDADKIWAFVNLG
jgi:hypothetical protein